MHVIGKAQLCEPDGHRTSAAEQLYALAY
jgi:hypothetical protein